jgi:fructosamine-3-kinase
MGMSLWPQITQHISQVTGQLFAGTDRHSVSGGCINQGYRLTDGVQQYFVKLNQASAIAMFAAEALALQHLHATETMLVPQPICVGTAEQSAYIVLTWLDLGAGTDPSWAEMGRQLAQLHRIAGTQGFGWERANTIGSTPQINDWTSDWVTFWTQHRLGYQFRLAHRRGGHFPQAEPLLAAMPQLLADHHPQPSLVHGDLWSGNAAITATGVPVIFDPAVYWGDREVDLAMTELFGGFPRAFYQGYDQVYPRDRGYAQRKTLYNLYHILNHFNLFGGSYAAQANRMIATLLAS